MTKGSKEVKTALNTIDKQLSSLSTSAEKVKELLKASLEINQSLTDSGSSSVMNKKVEAKIDDTIASLTGGDGKIKSFVSDKNTRVTAVQFVISADPIKGGTKNKTTPPRPFCNREKRNISQK